MGFSSTLWAWYGQNEYKQVLAACEVIEALGFLAQPSDIQQTTIPDCPACEVWSEMILPIEKLLSICRRGLPEDVKSRLEDIWQRCNSLTEAAFHCHERLIFEHEEWMPIRTRATELMALMESSEIHPFLGDLQLDCKKLLSEQFAE
ncbi:hypothetical protein [Pseudomonas sp. S3_H04]